MIEVVYVILLFMSRMNESEITENMINSIYEEDGEASTDIFSVYLPSIFLERLRDYWEECFVFSCFEYAMYCDNRNSR